MKLRASEIALAALVVAAVAGGVGLTLSFDAGMDAANRAPADPRAQLNTAIAEAIRVASAGDYATLYREFVPPQMQASHPELTPEKYAALLKEAEAKQAMDEFVSRLRSLQGQKPELDAEGTRAIFTLTPPVSGPPTLVFVKVNGLWYFER